MIRDVDLYVGADWSGARGRRLKSFRVAVCEAGSEPPRVVPGPINGDWSRPAFLEWLLGQVASGARIVCGLDFSFCFPYCDRDNYFPEIDEPPRSVPAFWSLVEAVCARDGDLFGGRLAEEPRFADFFRSRGKLGRSYERRLRVTEHACQEQGLGTPESVFNLVGARQVGKSSLAGMRFLRALKVREKDAAIWPFDDVAQSNCIMLEMFPTAFVRRAGQGSGKLRTLTRLNDALAFYRSEPFLQTSDFPTDDETDALISAAALRMLSGNEALWNPRALSDSVRRYEGWTFGVD